MCTSGAYPEPWSGAAGGGQDPQDWTEEIHRPPQVPIAPPTGSTGLDRRDPPSSTGTYSTTYRIHRIGQKRSTVLHRYL